MTEATAGGNSIASQGWTPGPGVTDHAGRPLPRHLDFFAPPPAELGPVLSAFSEVADGDVILSRKTRFAVWAAMIAAVAYVGHVMVRVYSHSRGDFPDRTFGLCVLADAVVVILGLMVYAVCKWPRTSGTCSYVCRDGVATFTLRGGRRVKPKDVMPFASAAALYVYEVDYYVNFFLYGGSHFDYTWRDGAGKDVMRLSGGHYERGRDPRPNSVHSLALAAEAAWTRHALGRAMAQMESTGFANFPIGPKEWVRVGKGVIDVCDCGVARRLTADQVQSVSVVGGKLRIHTHDAGMLPFRGKFAFHYGHVPNAQVLLGVVEAALNPALTRTAA